MKMQEHGPREKLTVNLPWNPAIRSHYEAIMELRRNLSDTFGGYTERAMSGGWVDERGCFMVEPGSTFEVSYCVNVESRADAIQMFVAAGRACDQEWVHIERSTFFAEHRRALVRESEYSNV